METSEYYFAADVATQFYDCVVVEGWFWHPSDPIDAVAVVGGDVVVLDLAAGFCHEGVKSQLGTSCGFRIKAYLRSGSCFDLVIEFTTKSGNKILSSLDDLTNRAAGMTKPHRMYTEFKDRVRDLPGATLLDLGGRNRSGLDHSQLFVGARCTVFDIKEGENVTMVGDAHRLSQYFPRDSFDFVHSVSVFEHLAMPWVVATEMNQVLKTGGVAFVATHQSIGMHDRPWDFWRFSDRAFHSLFNEATGFEILETEMNTMNFIVPFHITRSHRDYLKTCGFETSCVLARKIGPTKLEWSVNATIQANMYPG